MTYSLSSNGGIIRDADGAFIPHDGANMDYQAYLAWLAAGNVATPYAPPPITWAQYQAEALAALEKTSVTMERVQEGVSLGSCALTNADVQAFMNYRRALRNILSQKTGTPSVLPAQPPYPAGT
jgi:hypothetical protein